MRAWLWRSYEHRAIFNLAKDLELHSYLYNGMRSPSTEILCSMLLFLSSVMLVVYAKMRQQVVKCCKSGVKPAPPCVFLALYTKFCLDRGV